MLRLKQLRFKLNILLKLWLGWKSRQVHWHDLKIIFIRFICEILLIKELKLEKNHWEEVGMVNTDVEVFGGAHPRIWWWFLKISTHRWHGNKPAKKSSSPNLSLFKYMKIIIHGGREHKFNTCIICSFYPLSYWFVIFIFLNIIRFGAEFLCAYQTCLYIDFIRDVLRGLDFI
jgi:hypothetical protein